MTNVYFVRHAESDNKVHDDMSRPLTEKGTKDRSLVTNYLGDKGILAVFSSPYKRAYDTVEDFAQQNGLDITCIDDFRERKVADTWIEDFSSYAKMQWEDFGHKILPGESLGEVQARNIKALHELLASCNDKNIVIGTHGTALSTVVNYFDNSFSHDRFNEIVGLMPWIVHFAFEKDKCISIDYINLFE